MGRAAEYVEMLRVEIRRLRSLAASVPADQGEAEELDNDIEQLSAILEVAEQVAGMEHEQSDRR